MACGELEDFIVSGWVGVAGCDEVGGLLGGDWVEGSVVTFDFFFEFELFDSELLFSLSEFIVGAFGLKGSSFDFEVTNVVLDFSSETFKFLA